MSYLEQKVKLWNNISYRVKNAGETSFNEMPIGIIVFDDDSPAKKQNNRQSGKVVQPKQVHPKKTNDDFFDMNVPTKKSGNKSEVTKELSNKDFDF